MIMNNAVLLLDVGGSYTRARLVQIAIDAFVNPGLIETRTAKIADKGALLRFISGLLTDTAMRDRLHMAVISIAGPVTGNTVSMINWLQPDSLSLDELVETGLPAEQTILVNDMQAAAHCLIAYKQGKVQLEVKPLHVIPNEGPRQNDNAVLIIPGTGVGVAAVIAGRPGNKQSAPVSVSCELQHTAIPILNSEHQQILNILKHKLGKTRPSWEDFISGKGLENIYDALMQISNDVGNTISGLPANEIAERAVQKSDTRCQAAMDMFYRCVGALAQVLALTFQPYGGIYLAGESSRRNSLFIPQSPLLPELHNNPVRYDLLQTFPVYLVPADINLDGAACIASQQLSRLNNSH